ncbi:PREDICTED: uncharacterized protein LOC105969674 [Erythranthe guttata]|uniref:uncharacterized protein LOC105969674 n=1 Tax=Erythranthe guttata TaxID=4155 RepID=UPI00064D7915|nr:PREDICTED: uncharacterized protein LOC105969674 [Erythranthe guttata]|eukprot:XP_012849901.1 PREDICTED: uncharacterized protein LOC105969674 [Erythranthe guttata]
MSIVMRFHHPPIKQRSLGIIQQIVNRIGEFLEVLNLKQSDVAQFISVKVRLDVTPCLKRGCFFMLQNGTRIWVAFTYERLPKFCFLCGIIGHGEQRCPMRYEDNFVDPGEDLPYGTWMRVSNYKDVDKPRPPLIAVAPGNTPSASISPESSMRDKIRDKVFSWIKRTILGNQKRRSP